MRTQNAACQCCARLQQHAACHRVEACASPDAAAQSVTVCPFRVVDEINQARPNHLPAWGCRWIFATQKQRLHVCGRKLVRAV